MPRFDFLQRYAASILIHQYGNFYVYSDLIYALLKTILIIRPSFAFVNLRRSYQSIINRKTSYISIEPKSLTLSTIFGTVNQIT